MLIHNADITGSLTINGVPYTTGSYTGIFIAGTNIMSANTVSLTGSFTGSFFGDGSQLSGVTSYTDADTLSFIQGYSGSYSGSFSGSFFGDGSNLTGVTSYTDADTLAFINSLDVVSGSIQTVSTVSDTFTSVTSYTVTHNFGTKEVIVSVYENDTLIFPSSINTPTINTVTITFPEPVTGRVVVVKAGHIVSGSINYNSVLNKPTLVSGSSQISFTGITNKPTLVSGSSQITYSGLTGIPSGILSGSSQVTYSGLTGIPSGIISGSAQVAQFGYATTGSNQFKASQTITGSLTTTGQIIAQTLNVQQVTSSVVFSSGSNRFGNNTGNTHQFTGSMNVTGSLTVVGALNGTSAAFSSFGRFGGSNIATNFAVNTGANTSIYFNEIDSSTTELSAVNNANNAVRILKLQSPGGGTQIGGTLAVTGSATFLSTLNGTSGNFSGNIQLGTIGGGSSTATPNSINLASTFSNTAGSNLKLKLFEDTGANIYGIGVSNNQMDFNIPSGATYRFYTGAATFASSVTTTSLTTGTSTGSSINITTNNNNGTSGSPLQTNVNFYGFNGNLNGQIRVDDIAGTAQVGTMKFYTWNSGQVLALTLAQSGTATFSSNVVASEEFQGRFVRIREASATRGGFYPYNLVAGGGTDYSLGIFSEGEIYLAPGGSATKRFTMTNAGAATFSSSVTAAGVTSIATSRFGTATNYVSTFADGSGVYFENTGTSTATRQIRFQGLNDAGNGYSQFFINHGAGNYQFWVNDQLRIRIDGDGLKFNADTAAANALDDYEEGTWTPVVKIGTTTNSGTGRGRYTKIGNVVYIQATITSITKSGTGGLTVEGLPFTIGTSGTFGDVQGTLRWDDITSSGVIYPYFSSDQTRIIFQDFSNTGYVNTVQDSQISSTYQLYGISGFYMV